MLLRPTLIRGVVGKRIFDERLRMFNAGAWTELTLEARQDVYLTNKGVIQPTVQQQNEEVVRLIKDGEISRACHRLDSPGLAPGSQQTFG